MKEKPPASIRLDQRPADSGHQQRVIQNSGSQLRLIPQAALCYGYDSYKEQMIYHQNVIWLWAEHSHSLLGLVICKAQGCFVTMIFSYSKVDPREQTVQRTDWKWRGQVYAGGRHGTDVTFGDVQGSWHVPAHLLTAGKASSSSTNERR